MVIFMNYKKDEDEEDDIWNDRDPFRKLFGFPDIDKEFQRMQKLADELLKQGMSDRKDPFVYGFSVRRGPEGEPRIKEFGNAKDYFTRRSGGREEDRKSEWTPLTDIQETEDHIKITVDIPGVEKDNINIEVIDSKLILDVEGERNYRDKIELPSPVKSSESEATYNNGVLEIKLAKKREEKGESIKIE